MSRPSLANERIGFMKKNKNGSDMIVEEYYTQDDILVRFIEHGNSVHTNWKSFIKGGVYNVYDKNVYGIGYAGEGDYKPCENKKDTLQYSTWHNMLMRCYDKKFIDKNPTYIHCSTVDKWHNFQNFAEWYENNYYSVDDEKMHLDKDILQKGNKLYSPTTCVFVPHRINLLFAKRDAKRGDLPIGVYFSKNASKYVAQCSNGTGNVIYLKSYDTPEQAFISYKTFKEKLIKQKAEEYKVRIPTDLYNAMMKYEVEIDD